MRQSAARTGAEPPDSSSGKQFSPMFDFSWSEILVIGVVALIAIPPKDMPRALRTAGQLVRRARSLAREFHNSVDEMIREAELDEVQRSIRKATEFDVNRTVMNAIEPPKAIEAQAEPPPDPPPPDAPPPEALPSALPTEPPHEAPPAP